MIKSRSEQFKNLLEILIIALLVIIAFFWTTKSYASGTPYYTGDLTSGSDIGLYSDQTVNGQYVQTYTPSSTVQLCTIVLNIKKTGNPSDFHLQLSSGLSNVAGQPSLAMVLWAASSSNFTATSTNYNFTVSPCQTLNPEHMYGFYIFANGTSTTDQYTLKRSANVTTTNGTINRLYYNDFGGFSHVNFDGTFLQARVYPTAELAASIDFIFPTNGTTTGEFSNWNILATGEVATIKINYSGNFSSFQDVYSPNVSVANVQGFSILKRNSLGSTSTIWFATAYLYDSIGELTAQSQQIIFTFNPALTPSNTFHTVQDYLQSIYSGTATLTLPYNDASSSLSTCNPFNLGTCFVNAAKAIGHFLFTPSQNTSDQLKNSLISFSTIFPFTIPMTIIQEINNQASTTPASGTLSLTIPDLKNLTVTLISPTSTETVVGTTAKNAYYNAARVLMYLATGAHMFFVVF